MDSHQALQIGICIQMCPSRSVQRKEKSIQLYYSWTLFPGGPLIFKGGYDARTWDLMDPKQVFSPTKNHALNKYFWLFCYPKQVSNALLLSIPFLFWSLLYYTLNTYHNFQGLKNILFFSKFCCFWHPFQYPFYLFSCTSIISTFEYKWPPRPC